jgi:hypothetical protein
MKRVISLTVLTMTLVGFSAASGSAAVVAPASITVTSAAIDPTNGGVIIHIMNASGWHRDGGDVTSASARPWRRLRPGDASAVADAGELLGQAAAEGRQECEEA